MNNSIYFLQLEVKTNISLKQNRNILWNKTFPWSHIKKTHSGITKLRLTNCNSVCFTKKKSVNGTELGVSHAFWQVEEEKN